MWAVDTYDAKDLKRLVKGGFEATVEVQGTASCENPIVSLAVLYSLLAYFGIAPGLIK